MSVCQASAKPSWKKNIQQLSPARGSNIQSLSQMINDICQLTKRMASAIWGHGPAVHSTPVEPAKSILRWEKAFLFASLLEIAWKQAAFLLLWGQLLARRWHLAWKVPVRARDDLSCLWDPISQGLAGYLAGGHTLELYLCWDVCSLL